MRLLHQSKFSLESIARGFVELAKVDISLQSDADSHGGISQIILKKVVSLVAAQVEASYECGEKQHGHQDGPDPVLTGFIPKEKHGCRERKEEE